MILAKKCGVLSIFSVIVSTVLYGCILFWELDVFEFEGLHILLTLAQLFLCLFILFLVFAVLGYKFNINIKKLKKFLVAGCVALTAVSVAVICYNSINYYDWYTPKEVMDNNPELVQDFLPYHKVNDVKYKDISISHIAGTDYLTISSKGSVENGGYINYNAEYFESLSPFMNLKFYLERGLLLPSDLIYVDAFVKTEKIKFGGINVTVFTKEIGNDIGLYIKDGNKAIYAELDNDYSDPIDTESFANTVIEQFALMDETVDEKVWLSIERCEVVI